MRSLSLLLVLPLAAGCSITTSPEPSLAPRAAEAIDPRLPIPDEEPSGTVDPALAGRLSALVATVRSAMPAFEAREVEAGRLAAAAGPVASESWIAAEQALSRLVEQHGVTTHAAADIDAVAASRLESQRWIAPAERQAIAAAAAEVGSISARQAEAIDRLKDQLAR
ncbi:MAG: hypothetical protein M3Q19_00895 [Pseudomonadota bacterium]|nr:hypothetical protein [Pseudomonadota bacterium]